MTKKEKKPTKAEIKKQEKQIKTIQQKRQELADKLVKKQPFPFKIRDLIHDFFASLVFGLTLIFKGNLVNLASHLSYGHIVAIVISTLVILTFTIYFTGYKGLTDKTVNFFIFWLDRILGHYSVAIIVAAYLVFLFGLNLEATSVIDIYKMVIALSMPCAIGAAVPNLLKEY